MSNKHLTFQIRRTSWEKIIWAYVDIQALNQSDPEMHSADKSMTPYVTV